MFGKKVGLLGLDIGSHSVKLLKLEVRSNGIKLIGLGVVPLPPDAFTEGRVSKSDLVAKTIQQLGSHLKIKEKMVAASVSGYEVMIKKIDLPLMSQDDLDKRMHAELGQYIPYNVEEVDVDYQILETSKERQNVMDVLLVAAKKDSVNEYVSLVRLAGYEPMVIDVDFFALGNAFEATYGFERGTNIALVDIGANKTIMNILNSGIPVFTRGLSIGGSQISEGIKGRFRATDEEAERIKLGDIPSAISVHEVEEIFISVVRSWVREFKRAIDFYFSNFPDGKIDKIYLSGGSCRIPGLDKVFQDSVDTEVEIFNPLTRMEYDSKAIDSAYLDYIGPQMAISVGLALRKVEGK